MNYDQELIKHYYLDREGIPFVTNFVWDVLSMPTRKSQLILPKPKVVTILCNFATGKMQLNSGDDLGPSQQTGSRIIRQNVYALNTMDIMCRFIIY